jgi:cell cycle checkpoint control protein RAD9A
MKLIVSGSLAFTKGVTCISKYGDEMYIFASAECLILSATNTAETSYCRFQYSRMFFTRYSVGQKELNRPSGSQEPFGISGQVLTKASQLLPVQRFGITDGQWLLPVLKRGAGDKAVEKCELSIVDPEVGGTEDEEDSLESKLVVRMHCKHGGVHCLLS